MADDPTVNILAFFYVVASSQISPHFIAHDAPSFSDCKDSQKIAYAKNEVQKFPQVSKMSYLCRSIFIINKYNAL